MVNLLASFLSIVFCFTFSKAISADPVPNSCSYTVITKTSCSSSSQTRDKISLAFGDTYGHEVYAPRLDDPRSKTFEKCSTDTFQIQGPCMYDICYVYLLRLGSDGWKPESVKLYGADGKATTYYFNKFLPNGVWFGYNNCNKSFS
ncbi:hypothetical protein ACJIZ3_024420 [Penstemon smallii]|uniref:Uncharacterized protein n=1 Tax=Penstemon smallii TaxID=265156 RepID=A0ABD3TRT2_9LAMI